VRFRRKGPNAQGHTPKRVPQDQASEIYPIQHKPVCPLSLVRLSRRPFQPDIQWTAWKLGCVIRQNPGYLRLLPLSLPAIHLPTTLQREVCRDGKCLYPPFQNYRCTYTSSVQATGCSFNIFQLWKSLTSHLFLVCLHHGHCHITFQSFLVEHPVDYFPRITASTASRVPWYTRRILSTTYNDLHHSLEASLATLLHIAFTRHQLSVTPRLIFIAHLSSL
jgi:hypothetical protein